MEIKKQTNLRGELTVPGDKSISHRAVMFGSLAQGTTKITHFLEGADCLSTISCFRKMGIDIERNASEILVHGKGLHGLSAPSETLDVGNSGTTTRLISGILAGQSFTSELNGDASIQSRPMKRIMTPLLSMGADIVSLRGNGCAPLRITGKPLQAVHYQSPVASAQVKSCVLLAGMYADGITSVTEPVLSRNHTEIMLNYFGANVTSQGTTASIEPEPVLNGREIKVPGDISSAAFIIVGALICKNSEVLIKNVGLNDTRVGIIEVIKKMNGNIEIIEEHEICGEKVGDILVRYSPNLIGTTIDKDLIPRLIDEIPIIAVLATQAEGDTIIKDAAELKVKESNRIKSVVDNLNLIGANVIELEDGMIIKGKVPLQGGKIQTFNDHRIAMSFSIANLISNQSIILDNDKCIDISFPGYFNLLKKLSK